MARRRSGRPRGEVAEICKALDHLSTMNGSKPDVIQLKRDCFQKLIRYMTQVGDERTALRSSSLLLCSQQLENTPEYLLDRASTCLRRLYR